MISRSWRGDFQFWAFVIVALALAWFGFVSVAHAQTYLYDEAGGNNTENSFGSSPSGYKKQAFQFHATSTFYISEVRVDVRKQGSPTDFAYIAIQGDTAGVPNSTVYASSSPTTITATTTDGIRDQIFTFNGQSIAGGTDYWLVLQRTGSLSENDLYYVRFYSGSGFGSRIGRQEQNDTYTAQTGLGLYQIYAGLVDSISITSPANGATSTQTSALWTVDVNRATSTDTYGVEIRYSSTSSIPSSTSGSLGGIKTNPTDGSNTTTNYLFLEASTTYYARAFLYHESGAYVASSSVISFSTGVSAGGASGSWGSPTSTATSSEWVITCDPTSGAFVNSLCNLALALFIPKTSDFERFNDLYTGIENKPPIGYFTLVKNAINSISTSTTSTFALADLSSIEGTFLSPIKTGVSLVLWVLFLFWAFSRFRHFEL